MSVSVKPLKNNPVQVRSVPQLLGVFCFFGFFCSVLQFYIIFLVSKSPPFNMILREGWGGGGEMDEQGSKSSKEGKK